jgi:hypothetical protein
MLFLRGRRQILKNYRASKYSMAGDEKEELATLSKCQLF